MRSIRLFEEISRRSRYLRISRGQSTSTVDETHVGNKNEKTEATPEQAESTEKEQEVQRKLGGFARSFEKFSKSAEETVQPKEIRTFANLLRHSNFINLGDPKGKMVIGKIFNVVGNDLYIDFGWKFHCVCQKPVKNGECVLSTAFYTRGSLVRLRIKELEISSKFLGANSEISILEADCTLMGLVRSPIKRAQSVVAKS